MAWHSGRIPRTHAASSRVRNNQHPHWPHASLRHLATPGQFEQPGPTPSLLEGCMGGVCSVFWAAACLPQTDDRSSVRRQPRSRPPPLEEQPGPPNQSTRQLETCPAHCWISDPHIKEPGPPSRHSSLTGPQWIAVLHTGGCRRTRRVRRRPREAGYSLS